MSLADFKKSLLILVANGNVIMNCRLMFTTGFPRSVINSITSYRFQQAPRALIIINKQFV